jgi:hypothetical protein
MLKCSPLVLSVVDICAGKVSPFTGLPVAVVAAGGIYDGRGLAMSLCYGAQAKPPETQPKTPINFPPSRLYGWVRVSSAPPKQVLPPATSRRCWMQGEAPASLASCSASNCGLCGCFNARFCSYDDTVRTLIFTGRPLRVLKTPYIAAWEDRQQDIRQLCARGTVPFVKDVEENGAELMKERPLLMGQVGNVVITSEPNFRRDPAARLLVQFETLSPRGKLLRR